MTSSDIRADARRAAQSQGGDYGYTDIPGTGLVGFAALMLGLGGAWNVVEGILAIGDSRVFVGETTFVFSDLNTWGWIILCIGVVQGLAALGIFLGNQLARWVGVLFASLNAIAQLLFIPSYPFFALAVFALDILVIYGLVAHGRERAW